MSLTKGPTKGSKKNRTKAKLGALLILFHEFFDYLLTTIFVRPRSAPALPGVVSKLICGLGCDVTGGESTGITVVPLVVVVT